ncbi:MAG: hypothetical protein ACYST0_08120, partial [Planctomycetota bacterium]
MVAVLGLVLAPAAWAQVRPAQDPYGKIVKAIGIESLTGEFKVSEDLIRSRLRTEVDKPLRNEHIQADLTVLWKELSLRADVSFVVVEGGIKVVFRVHGDKIFNRLEFNGLNHFKEDQVRLLLGISTKVRLSRSEADQYALRLRDRYLKD